MTKDQVNGAVWSDNLDQILHRVWGCLCANLAPETLANGIAEKRLVTLATIGADGGPEQRNVMLRDVDSARGLIDIHTDSATVKIAEIRAVPKVSLLLWRADMKMQMRLKGRAEIVLGDDAAHLWSCVPEAARPNYGILPAPGSKISAPGNFSRQTSSARFAVLRICVEALDVVILAEPQHRRAVFERRDGWRGAWLAP